MDENTSIFEAIENADTVEEAVGLALGAASALGAVSVLVAASVCWDELPSGVFLSDQAMLILESLMKRIND